MSNEELFNKNINIAYKIANRYKINYPNELEDITQIALMGLWKCVLNYNDKYELSTYAYTVIPSQINMYLRHIRKHEKNISINTIVCDDDAKSLTLEDILDDKNNYVDNVINKINFENIFKDIEMNNRERKIIILRLNGYTQSKMTNVLNITQGQISRIEKELRKKINNYINGNI